jgi:tRNA (guanine-N7-)-methyltransferase
MHSSSPLIISNQQEIHPNLDAVVMKHLTHPNQKPIAEHTREAFDRLDQMVKSTGRPVVLDSCCGVGESTMQISKLHPEALVIGLDKSAHRLAKGHAAGDFLFERVDLNDCWRLIADAHWPVTHHYLLYPNPWPKSKHLQRRWYAAPVFQALLSIGGKLHIRTNWRIYIEEFARALTLAGYQTQVDAFICDHAWTPFERKYQQNGHQLWQLDCYFKNKALKDCHRQSLTNLELTLDD